MAERKCPVCGDPRPYVLWVGHDGPPCPYGAHVVTDCSHQMQEARRIRLWQQHAPECHDNNGNLRAGQLPVVLERMRAAALDPWMGAPVDA